MLKENIFLKNYTTFKIGGPAKFFFEAKIKKDLIKAIKLAKKNNLPFFVLGHGSNLLVSDKGFNGLVIKIRHTTYDIRHTKIYAEAGTPLALLVSEAAKNGLTGLEWAAGIPGTIGGAIYGNAGAFKSSMADIVTSVEVLKCSKSSEVEPRKIVLRNKDCQFGYRDSIFKHDENLIILSAEIQLEKGDKKNIKEKMKKYLERRKETQPLNFPSAGSIFKNPKGFSAGEFIEKCGLKGKKIGDVEISKKQANFIVNLGQGKAKDVMALINLAKKKVKQKFGIELKEEIVILKSYSHLTKFLKMKK